MYRLLKALFTGKLWINPIRIHVDYSQAVIHAASGLGYYSERDKQSNFQNTQFYFIRQHF